MYQLVIEGTTLRFCEDGEERMRLPYLLMEGVDMAAAVDLINLLMNEKALIQLNFEDVLASFADAPRIFVATGALKSLEEFCGAVCDDAVVGLAVPRLESFDAMMEMLVPLQRGMGDDGGDALWSCGKTLRTYPCGHAIHAQ